MGEKISPKLQEIFAIPSTNKGSTYKIYEENQNLLWYVIPEALCKAATGTEVPGLEGNEGRAVQQGGKTIQMLQAEECSAAGKQRTERAERDSELGKGRTSRMVQVKPMKSSTAHT